MSPLALVEIGVLAVLGIAALALGGGMALRPSQQRYEGLRPVTVAMVFGSVGLTLTGLTNLCVGLSRVEWTMKTGQVACAGLAELFVPSLLVFGVLTIAWGLSALGLRRMG